MSNYDDVSFDELRFVVSKNGESLTLNPLSFKMLQTLAQADGDVVSIKSLLDTVWHEKIVSPETLKQRVFVLRKALDESSINGLEIQTVRGEGYRLLIENLNEMQPGKPRVNEPKEKVFSPQNRSKVGRYVASFCLAFVVVAITIFALSSQKGDKVNANNRIALWSNVLPADMADSAKQVYLTWDLMLAEASKTSSVQLVMSNQRQELSIPIQARKDRLALISYFEVIESNNETTITLKIVEPTTATILRSNMFSLDSDPVFTDRLESQLSGIKSLVASNKLYLNKQQRDYASHPIWAELRALANSS